MHPYIHSTYHLIRYKCLVNWFNNKTYGQLLLAKSSQSSVYLLRHSCIITLNMLTKNNTQHVNNKQLTKYKASGYIHLRQRDWVCKNHMMTRASYHFHYTWSLWSVKLVSAALHHHSYTSNYPPATANPLVALFQMSIIFKTYKNEY